MDKNQVHKIGKIINKPIKFIKNNSGKIVTGLGTVAYLSTLVKNNQKK
ncbi:TPA: hypothetical protein TZY74_000949 [Streptococcus suis]|uniref:Uncharacterized protein n=1 Tax=Streptococcus suis TaxID=1307 RepID=A0A0Z8IF79_STRSU|nr:hypothetical protein [Streptococcus suis]MCK3904246.1 hypothetical protein [Streptococcus suis]MCQ8785128.1 hypothetical protein [Streptococcus suis]MDW8719956.1 hypothetical protein [Streptococcus suis]MDY7596460.1 hypothetical protein [Streptococcus suis]NQH11950.1 hypothetical protein [Streptococcus suis]